MKLLVVLSALVAFTAAGALTQTELELQKAFTFDNNYALLANREQTKLFLFDCLLENGDCGPYKQEAELSMKLMVNQCANCSPTQKAEYDSLLKQLHDQFEPLYNELMKKVAANRD